MLALLVAGLVACWLVVACLAVLGAFLSWAAVTIRSWTPAGRTAARNLAAYTAWRAAHPDEPDDD